MRVRARQRQRLQELLHITGDIQVAVALPWLRHWQSIGADMLLTFLGQVPLLAATFAAAERIRTTDAFADCRHAYLPEELLAVSQSHDRRRRGVYFTPREIVRYIVQAVDQALAQRLEWPEGLAHSEVRLLDPAAGSGVFLSEVIRSVHDRKTWQWRESGCCAHELDARWQDYVSHELLPHLTGWEILPTGVVAAHCLLAETLRETGYLFGNRPLLRIECRDALGPPKEEERFNVIVGNPPYASLSVAAHGWIEGLIQDDYTRVDGRPLGEKKHWLHDDYVKFLRLAQWHIEQCGSGVVGMVTNHGYLQNASFRGMRASLLQTFSHIEIVDLHGNAKLRERSPDGRRDENVFGIALGAAISLFVRSPDLPSGRQVSRCDLWGSRGDKLQRLSAGALTMTAFTPAGPRYEFAPSEQPKAAEYDAAWRLCDAMPMSTTAPVTARDHFVVAFTRAELIERVAAFCDLSIPDEVIRERYFTRTRSSKYPLGDSRSWELPLARRQLSADPHWQNRIVLCQYRPLDYRYVLWHNALVDWPRREVMRHLLEHDNVALIARRQSPANSPANYFWATRSLALDGIVRSDNRGSESLFPLWRHGDDGIAQANFAPDFIAAFERVLRLRFVEVAEPLEIASPAEFTPLSLAGFIYGLFWSAEYRQRYRSELTADFPHILPPASADAFFTTSRRGLQLLQAHTLQVPSECNHETPEAPLAPGYPRWRAGRVWLNGDTTIAEIDKAVWELRIGAHQVARKWLNDRRGLRLAAGSINTYRSVLAVLSSSVTMNPL
jgi:predicted helicase